MLGAMLVAAPAAATTNIVVPPAAPAHVEVVPGDSKVTVRWSPVPGADGYRVYRGVKGVWISTPVGRTVTTSHTSTGLANGTTYSFTVAAYTKAGNGPLSLAVSATPIAPPQEVTIAASDRRVTLDWQPSAGATSYSIYRKVGAEGQFAEIATGVMTPPFQDMELANGSRHYYEIRAMTAAAESDASVRVSAIPVPPAPASVPVVSAVAGHSKVSLTWSAVPEAPGYSIYRSTTGAFLGPAIATTTTTTFKDSGLDNDTTYFYTVAARNLGGDGPRAAAVTAVPVAPPLAPEHLVAVPGKKQMSLSWATSAGATAYNVYRSTKANREATQLVAEGVAGSRFVDTTVSTGLTYFYQVTASNSGGESARSSEVGASKGIPIAELTAESLEAVDFCAARPTNRLNRLWRTIRRF